MNNGRETRGYIMRVTIKEVAKKCGFSITSVSLVLNNKENKIPESSRQIILEAAEEMGYRPNRLAVGLLKKKTKLLGLVIPDNSNMFFSELSKSVEVAARKRGYSLIYGNTSDVYSRDYEYLKLFVDHQVDGIVITKSSHLPEKDDIRNMEFLEKSGVPFVVVDRQPKGFKSNMVTVNNVTGGYLATRYLIEQGHSKIGCFTGPLGLTTSQQRLEGYKNALAEADIDFNESFVVEGNFSSGFENKAMTRFIDEKVTAIFCQNDIMAFGIYREANKFGIKIPTDLSVIGYDNINLCDIVYPGLTTIHQPIDQIGEESVRILTKLIDTSEEVLVEVKELEPKLVIRSSVLINRGGK
jgi:LacI family transcriptional regulator